MYPYMQEYVTHIYKQYTLLTKAKNYKDSGNILSGWFKWILYIGERILCTNHMSGVNTFSFIMIFCYRDSLYHWNAKRLLPHRCDLPPSTLLPYTDLESHFLYILYSSSNDHEWLKKIGWVPLPLLPNAVWVHRYKTCLYSLLSSSPLYALIGKFVAAEVSVIL